MASIASKFSEASTKFQVGVATCAVASAAAFAPVVAQAAPMEIPSPLAPVSALLSADIALAPFIHQDLADDASLEWGWIWLGSNRNPPVGPASDEVIAFTPLSLIPGFLKPLYKALTGWIDFQFCVFGVSLRIGPYGRTSVTVGKGC